VRRLSLTFSGSVLTLPVFKNRVRLSLICLPGVAGVCVLTIADGSGVSAFVSASAGTAPDVVFADLNDPLGGIAAIPPDLIVTPQDTVTLTLPAPSTARAVISYEELAEQEE